jgi:hypothetical protein
MAEVGHFDICKEMAKRNLDIRLSSLSNIESMQATHKGRDTRITIGCRGNVITAITFGEFIGGLLLCNAKQYREIKAELEAADQKAEETLKAQQTAESIARRVESWAVGSANHVSAILGIAREIRVAYGLPTDVPNRAAGSL